MISDRAAQIIDELSQCAPAQMAGENIISVYLSVESLGKIFAYALEMRRCEERNLDDLKRLGNELTAQIAAASN